MAGTLRSLALIFCFLGASLQGQDTATILRGVVADPSGKSVPGATVVVSGNGQPRSATSDGEGRYEFRDIAAGAYLVRVLANGFAPSEVAGYRATSAVQVLNFSLKLAAATQQVSVNDSTTTLDTTADNNASALVLSGKDLDALSDDPDDLATDLAALAGPSAGPNGGQIYIDGFTGGRLPPKSSIREIRVNQSPFSAQYDRLGYGRVEILTKPGTEDFHGETLFQYGSDLFNSRNPFTTVKPPYQRRQWEGEATGPLGKYTTFSGDFEIRRMSDNAFVNAVTLDSNYNLLPVTLGVVVPVSSTEENAKLDHQLSTNHTLTLRYSFAQDSRDNQGIGGFSLPERAYHNRDTENTIQGVETAIFGQHLTNEIRVRYSMTRSRQTGSTSQPTISVMDSFTGGGAPLTLSFTNDNRLEAVNLTSLVHGPHLIRFGGRLRRVGLEDQDTSNYTGSFTFTSLDSYRITLMGLANGLSPAAIRAAGGGASQFSLAGGNPLATISQFDVGMFAQDDWRVKPNMTLSLGMRYEGQSHLGDHGNVAPRIGLAWGLGKGKTPKIVLRTGAGVFYDRVSESIALDALRRDGIHQQQFLVDSPDFFPAVPTTAQLAAGLLPQSIRRVYAGLAAPRMLQAAAGLERQIIKNVVLTANYVQTWGADQLRSRNINAPISGLYPYAGNQAIYLYESDGHFRQNQWITSLNARVSPKLTLTGSYTLNRARSDTDGAGTFPSNSYNLQPEWGRAGFDIRHRVQLNGTIGAPLGFRLSPMLVATSGRPFNITIGRDINGDTLFNDRPAFATDMSRATVVRTAWGTFDNAPLPGQIVIPRNYGSGPAQFSLNLRLQKVFLIGEPPAKGKGGRDPFELTFSINARNLLNHPNLGSPDGNLSSSLFGQSTGLASGGNVGGNRRIELQIKFGF